MATSARLGAKKWLASLFGESVSGAAASGAEKTSKSIAKERLQIILAHQRGSQVLAGVDLQALQAELLECVQRHIRVANGANINIAGMPVWSDIRTLSPGGMYTHVSFAVKHEGQLDIFEMQVPVDAKTLPGRGALRDRMNVAP